MRGHSYFSMDIISYQIFISWVSYSSSCFLVNSVMVSDLCWSIVGLQERAEVGQDELQKDISCALWCVEERWNLTLSFLPCWAGRMGCAVRRSKQRSCALSSTLSALHRHTGKHEVVPPVFKWKQRAARALTFSRNIFCAQSAPGTHCCKARLWPKFSLTQKGLEYYTAGCSIFVISNSNAALKVAAKEEQYELTTKLKSTVQNQSQGNITCAKFSHSCSLLSDRLPLKSQVQDTEQDEARLLQVHSSVTLTK